MSFNMACHMTQEELNIHGDKTLPQCHETQGDRLRSQSEILKRRSCSSVSRTFTLNERALSDSAIDRNRDKVNSFCVPQGLDNVAFETFGEQDIFSTVQTPSNIHADSESLKDHGGNESDIHTSSCSPSRFKGIILTLISTIFMSLSSLTVALLRGSVGSNEVAFAQMFLEFLLCLPLFTLERASLWLPRKALLLVLYRSAMGSICTILAFFAFQVMPIGNAKAIIFSSPVFTGLFSCMFLHEACTIVDILLSATTLFGVMLVIQPPFIFGGEQTSTTILGPIFCLIVAILVGTIFISLRKLGIYRVHPVTLLMYLTIVGMAVSIIMCTALREWVIPRCGRDRILLILTGTLQLVAQITLTQALRFEKATTVSLIRTSDVIFTFFLDYIFFSIIPNGITISGALLIVGSLIGITLYKMWTEQKKAEKAEKADSEEQPSDGDLE